MEIKELSTRLKRLVHALESAPNNMDLFKDCVDLCMRAGDFEQAQRLVEKALIHHPKELWIHVEQAKLQLVFGQYNQAIKTLNFVKEQGLYTPDILYYLTWAMLNLEQYISVIVNIARSYEFIVEYPALMLIKVRALYHLQQFDEAHKELDNYLKLDENNAEALGLKAMLLLDTANNKQAKYYAEKAIEIYPYNQEALTTLSSIALIEQQPNKVPVCLDSKKELPESSGRFMLNLGQIHLLNNQFDEAEKALKEAGLLNSDDIGTWHTLAWAEILLYKFEEAKCCFEYALELDYEFSESYGGLAVVAALQCDLQTAEKYRQKAVQLDPHSASAEYALTLIEEKKGVATSQFKQKNDVIEIRDLNDEPSSSSFQHLEQLDQQDDCLDLLIDKHTLH